MDSRGLTNRKHVTSQSQTDDAAALWKRLLFSAKRRVVLSESKFSEDYARHLRLSPASL